MRHQMHLNKIEMIYCILQQVASEAILLIYLHHIFICITTWEK